MSVLSTRAVLRSGEQTISSTGNQDDVAFGNAGVLRCNNATLLTIRGLKAGVPGQLLTILSVGAGQVELAHQNTNSTAANRLINVATSANTPLAAGSGTATYQYDGTTARWRLIEHDQGAYITPTFNAADYTGSGGMGVTVEASDVTTCSYKLRGRTLTMVVEIGGFTTTAPAGVSVQRTILGGFTNSKNNRRPCIFIDTGVADFGCVVLVAAATVFLVRCAAGNTTNWTIATNQLSFMINIDIEVD